MNNYENEIMNLLNGDTPRAKYDHLVKLNNLVEMIANPRRGTKEEHWNIGDAVDHINVNRLIPENSKY